MTQLEHYLNDLQRFGIRPGLERIRALLQKLDDPQNRYPVILVGGTNGKGSTSESLARGLAREKHRVGLFTSPHLYAWNERLRVLEVQNARKNGFVGSVADGELDALFNAARPQIEGVAASSHGQPTEFEVLTALGFLHFARQNVDVAIIEVGLGGRFDATNVCEPIVSVVTHVALDHCDRLGNTHAEIARDKIHIARAGRILVTAETRDDVLQIFRAHCDQIGARLWPWRDIEYSNDRELVVAALKNAPQIARDETDFQVVNTQTARVARAALAQTNARFPLNENLTSEKVSVPGRFQIAQDEPMLILDGANNPDGAQMLAAQLQRVLDERRDAKLTLVLGIFRDKDYESMIALLAPLAHKIIASQSGSPRACDANTIAEHARRFCANVEIVLPVQNAVEHALTSSTRCDVVCVTGSFFTISEALSA